MDSMNTQITHNIATTKQKKNQQNKKDNKTVCISYVIHCTHDSLTPYLLRWHIGFPLCVTSKSIVWSMFYLCGFSDIRNILFLKDCIVYDETRVYFQGPKTLQWHHNRHDGISNHQPHDCLLNQLFKAQIKENIKAPRHWPLWGEFTSERWISHTKCQ